VLDLSRIEAGTMVVASAAVELSPLVADCVRMVRGAAKRHEVTLSDATADAPALAVQADTTRLRQVLVNLLSNACKYNRPGGRVTIEAVRDGAAAVLRVSDTGIGLTARQVAMLYEPFNRLGAEAGVVEGTGIGLVITRGLVDLMGGRLDVESRPGVGSTFSVHLPLAQAAAPSPPETPTAAGAAFEAPGIERTVLYVEDNPSNAKLFTDILARRPHVRVLTAPDAVQGLRVATSRHLDAIVVDISLPGMDGLSLCRRLRELPQLAGTAIVALSANAMDADIARGREAGFDRYFTKPIAVGPFLQWLDDALAVAA